MGRASRAATLFAVLFAVASGCKKEEPVKVHSPPAVPAGVKDSVAGRVTYHGVGLASGWLQFFGETGEPIIAGIQMGGTYTLPDPPRGRVKVAVTSAPPAKLSKAPPSTNAGNRLPARYADPDTSGLTLNITGGKQTFNIALED